MAPDNNSFVHRERVRVASPMGFTTSTPTPGTWNELPPEQEGGFDRPATPRMSGAFHPVRDADNWDKEAPTGRNRWGFGASTGRPSCSTPGAPKPVSQPIVESVGGSVCGQPEEEEPAMSNRPRLSRQDAVIGSSEANTSKDWEATWEQCGLAGGKSASKSMHNVPDNGDDTSSVNDNSGKRNAPPNQPANQGNWNRPVYRDEVNAYTYQRPITAGGNWRACNTSSGFRGRVIHNNGNYGPAPENSLPQHKDGTGYHDSSPPSALHGPPGRRSINPDNYDGNRAGPDGSRVFYSAILPTVPTLHNIANHAEYTAWFDMLRSVLKYHQLAALIAPDANRPHGYKDGRRWDQDRLRAAIIIKGALSFEVFERVRRNGWRDTEDPTLTVEKIQETHGAVCPCGHSQGMTLLDF